MRFHSLAAASVLAASFLAASAQTAQTAATPATAHDVQNISVSSPGAPQPLPTAPNVATSAGQLAGTQQQVRWGAVNAYLGIPYAAPPVGPLRWRPPQPAPSWQGVRQATSFGSRCMQPQLYDDMFFRDPGASEDCLTLNVWKPAAAPTNAKLPVMVWIYGGGFMTGGTSEPRQDGANLAARGVIVVTFNYRLGIFGFYTHPELATESPAHAAGNYGLMDAVAALQWVRSNIAAFGGDPSNVTIFGESAGSFAVSALMASPMAHGLFERCIGESGGAFGATLRFQPVAERAARDADFARTALHANTLAELRALPAEQLLAAETPQPGGSGSTDHFGPDVDGLFLPQPAAAIFAAGKQNDVPLLAGWNHDEGGSGRAPLVITPTGGSNAPATADQPSDLQRLKDTAQKDFPNHVNEFLQAFPASTNEEAVARLQQYATARFIAYGTWKWLEAASSIGKSPVYRYRFDLVPPPDPARPNRFGAFHSDEIEYVFGNLDSRKGIAWRPEDYALSMQMQTYWTNFARTGDPNGRGLPKWPTYSAASGNQVMYLNTTSHAAKDDLRDEFLFLDAAEK